MAFKPKLGNSIAEDLANQQAALMKKDQDKNLEKKEQPTFNPAEQAKERIRIFFDDSGSMGGQKIKDAIDGCIEFMRNCVLNETACAIHPLNQRYQEHVRDLTSLTTNLPALSILITKIRSTGSTPLGETIKQGQECKPKATRYVVFSDGAPNGTYQELKEGIISRAVEEKTPIDCVLIWEKPWATIETEEIKMEDYSEYKTLKELADRTGGYFLVFDRSKVDFKSAFKYLAPTLRGKLSDGKIRLALMAGELK